MWWEERTLAGNGAGGLHELAQATELRLYSASSGVRHSLILMQRFTARLLLVLVLVGVLAPAGLAATAAPAHACCRRHPIPDATAGGVQIKALPACCNHDCCRSVTVSQWANVCPAGRCFATFALTSAPSISFVAFPASAVDHAHSGRAPPQFSVL